MNKTIIALYILLNKINIIELNLKSFAYLEQTAFSTTSEMFATLTQVTSLI